MNDCIFLSIYNSWLLNQSSNITFVDTPVLLALLQMHKYVVHQLLTLSKPCFVLFCFLHGIPALPAKGWTFSTSCAPKVKPSITAEHCMLSDVILTHGI